MSESLVNMPEVEGWEKIWEDEKRAPQDPLERLKRYGEIREFRETPQGYELSIQLPRQTPTHPYVVKYGLPRELPPYDIEARLINSSLVGITGILSDPSLLKLCGHVNSFPDRFYFEYPLPEGVAQVQVERQGYLARVKLVKEST